MLPLWFTSLAFAQATVVAVGDVPDPSLAEGAVSAARDRGVVDGPPSTDQTARPKPRTGGPAVAGGWVAVLADCLEERAPDRWSVIDRGSLGDSPRAVAERVGTLIELKPRVVVLGVGTREVADPDSPIDRFEEEVQGIIASLRGLDPAPGVLLLGVVPPTAEQLPTPVGQELLDARAQGLNRTLSGLIREGVVHLDLQQDWPTSAQARQGLTVDGWRLSDQGHARVAAAVCDAVLTRFSSP